MKKIYIDCAEIVCNITSWKNHIQYLILDVSVTNINIYSGGGCLFPQILTRGGVGYVFKQLYYIGHPGVDIQKFDSNNKPIIGEG